MKRREKKREPNESTALNSYSALLRLLDRHGDDVRAAASSAFHCGSTRREGTRVARRRDRIPRCVVRLRAKPADLEGVSDVIMTRNDVIREEREAEAEAEVQRRRKAEEEEEELMTSS